MVVVVRMVVVVVVVLMVVGKGCSETVHPHFAVFAAGDDAAVAYCDGVMLV